MILGLDPGREKCGLAVMNQEEEVVFQEVLSRANLLTRVEELLFEYGLERLVLGNGTLAGEVKAELKAKLGSEVEIIMIDESYSTLEARNLYWQDNKPRGWRRLLPLSLQKPPLAIDDYAAIILIKRFRAWD